MVYKRVSVQTPQLGVSSPSWGKRRGVSGGGEGGGTKDGTDVVNTRRWNQEWETEVGKGGGRLGREERTWRGESPGIVLREGNHSLNHG